MKTYGGNGCIYPRFLDLGTSCKSVGQLHAPAALTLVKEPPRKSLDRRLAGPQTRYEESENSGPTGTRTPTPTPGPPSLITDCATTALNVV
jgi:hypothetical protein